MEALRLASRLLVCVLCLGLTTCSDTSRAETSGVTLPSISLTPISPEIFEGEDLTLTCTYEADPQASVQWFVGGANLTDSAVYVPPATSTLRLVGVIIALDGASVRCEVHAGGGEVGEDATTLTVYSRSPAITSHPPNVTVEEGSSFSLHCQARGLPPPSFQWEHDGTPIFESPFSGTTVQQNGSDSTLTIPSTSPVNFGQYVCIASNSEGSAISREATVTVAARPDFVTTPPRMVEVLTGSFLLLPCTARGYPPPVISWTHNERIIAAVAGDQRVQVHSNGSLVIFPVVLMDSGVYLCHASNSIGEDSSDTSMVMVHMFPMFTRTPAKISFNVNTAARLNCTAVAIPPPEYSWLRDGSPVPLGLGAGSRVRLDSRGGGGALVISAVRREESGMYQCVAGNKHGTIMSLPVMLDVYAPPLPPTNVRVTTPVGSTWINLRWGASLNPMPPVNSYLVEYRLSFQPDVSSAVSTPAMSYNVSGLYPSAEYLLSVTAVSPVGGGEPSQPVNVTTEPGIPSEELRDVPEDVRVEPSGPDHLTVHWTIPEELLHTSYHMTRVVLHPLLLGGSHGNNNNSNNSSEVVSSSSPIRLLNLQPATTYSVEIHFIFAGDFHGRRTLQEASTQEDVPTAPTITRLTSSSPHTITVEWTEPNVTNGNITNYTVRYYISEAGEGGEGGEESVDGDTLSLMLEGLLAFTNYTVELSANTSAGEGNASLASIRTEEDVPPAPSGLAVEALSSTSLLVSWQPLPDEEVPGILANYSVGFHQRHRHHNTTIIVVEADMSNLTLYSLKPYTEYNVSVAAATGAGFGNRSDAIVNRTLGDVPVAVPMNVTVTPECPASLVVEWAEPGEGVYAAREDVGFVLRYSSAGGAEANTTVAPTTLAGRLNHTLSALTPFTNYTIAIAITNPYGTGSFSEAVQSTTCDALGPFPEDLELTVLSSTSVLLSWQQLTPEEVPGLLVNYVIKYGNETELTVTVPPNNFSYELRGLEPFTHYQASVASQTRAGVGNFSQPVWGQTLGDVPAAIVGEVTVQPLCPPVSLSVSWERPDDRLVYAPPSQLNYTVCYSRGEGGEGGGGCEGRPGSRTLTLQAAELENGLRATLTEGMTINSTYLVSVAIGNAHGTGNFTTPVAVASSPEGVPSPPQELVLSQVSSSVISAHWLLPLDPQGDPYYLLHYTTGLAATTSATSGNVTTQRGQLSVNITDLQPFTGYTVRVTAVTSCARSVAVETRVRTLEALPSEPLRLDIVVALPTSLVVGWAKPASPNGDITHYNVTCPGPAPSQQVGVAHLSSLSFECKDLLPDTAYVVTVAAVNGAGQGPAASLPASTACIRSAGEVRLQDDGRLLLTVGDRDTANCSADTLYMLVLVQELVSYANGTFESPSRPLSSFSLEQLLRSTADFKTQRSRRQTLSNGAVYIAANLSMGQEKDPFQLGDGMEYGGFTNYPLKPGVFYEVGLRGGVNGTNSTIFTAVEQTFTGSPPTQPPAAIPLVVVVASASAVGVLLLAITLVALISCCCCCCCSTNGEGKGTGVHIERSGSLRLSARRRVDPVDHFRANHRTEALEEHPPVPKVGFINKLLVMRTNDNQLFLEEFGSIPMTPLYPMDTADLSYNRKKNRYNNILPYDHSRVKLNATKGLPGSDYINANYCAGFMKTKSYVATQGPTSDTVPDFWRMVWEENCRTIVMLTNPQERGKPKCEVYWPRELGCTATHNMVEVTLTEMTQLADYTIRCFALQKVGSSKEPREIRQFHFTTWPDHGVPQYATAMLALIKRVRAHHRSDSGPMVVHCSAGVGRSGTFIVIDSMLQRLKHGDDVLDIYGHVTLLRSQRNFMVQTEDQYFFIYEAIAEALACGDTEIPLDTLVSYSNQLFQEIPEDESQTTYIELQFKRLALDKSDPQRFTTANRDCNKSKNRYVNVLPYETSRVCLEYLRGVDGSDYINASHIDSYHTRRAFIATQGPQAHTVVDLWRMVWQYNSPVVVMLTELVERGIERSAQYWPAQLHQPHTYGKIMVEMKVERHSSHYSYRDLFITDIESGQKRLVRHFHFHGWPDVGVPGSPQVFLDLLREVQKLYQEINSKAPITVQCSNGVGRTGVFIALHVILERMLGEGMVDVFQTVKNLRIQRPAMVQTLEQYQFCYLSAVHYLQSSELMLHLSRQRIHSNTTTSSETRRRNTGSFSSSSPRRQPPSRTASFQAKQQQQQQQQGQQQLPPSTSLNGNFDSTRNLNGGSQTCVYGGSEATSTFGNHTDHNSSFEGSPPHPISHTGSQVLLSSPSKHPSPLATNSLANHYNSSGGGNQADSPLVVGSSLGNLHHQSPRHHASTGAMLNSGYEKDFVGIAAPLTPQVEKMKFQYSTSYNGDLHPSQ